MYVYHSAIMSCIINECWIQHHHSTYSTYIVPAAINLSLYDRMFP